jgi:aryl-alcohol dehydrogenase
MAKEFGATHTVNAGEEDPVQAIRNITGGGAAFTLECVGNPTVFRQAVDALPVGGVCGLIGAAPGGTEVQLDMQTILNARTVRGIVEGDAVSDLFIPKIIDLYSQGKMPFDRLIKFYPLDDINRAVEDMEKGEVIKPVLRP